MVFRNRPKWPNTKQRADEIPQWKDHSNYYCFDGEMVYTKGGLWAWVCVRPEDLILGKRWNRRRVRLGTVLKTKKLTPDSEDGLHASMSVLDAIKNSPDSPILGNVIASGYIILEPDRLRATRLIWEYMIDLRQIPDDVFYKNFQGLRKRYSHRRRPPLVKSTQALLKYASFGGYNDENDLRARILNFFWDCQKISPPLLANFKRSGH